MRSIGVRAAHARTVLSDDTGARASSRRVEASISMRMFTLETSLWLPQPVDRVFSFFADAANLERLTPRWLRFEILTPSPVAMAEGTHIDYRLRYRGFPLHWRTEILAWEPPHRFVDSQVKGPYRRWVHQHVFAAQDGGTLATEHVEYALPGGALANSLLIGRDLERIFAYRQQRLLDIFDRSPAAK